MKMIICALSYGYGVFTNPQGTGIWQKRLVEAAKKNAIEVQFVYAPRMRCLNDVKNGAVDAVYAAPSKEREEFLVFPRKNSGEINEDLAVGVAYYKIYKLKNSPLDWDGNKFVNLKGTLIVQRGIQINDTVSANLTRAGIDKPYIVENSDLMMNMILLKRNMGGVMEESSAKASMEKLKITNIEATEKSFGKNIVFVAFNTKFFEKNKTKVENLWNEFR